MTTPADDGSSEERARSELRRLLGQDVSKAPIVARAAVLAVGGVVLVGAGAMMAHTGETVFFAAIAGGVFAAGRGIWILAGLLFRPVVAVVAGVVSARQEKRPATQLHDKGARTRVELVFSADDGPAVSRSRVGLQLEDGKRIVARTLWGTQVFGRRGDVGVAHLCGRTLLRFRRVPGLSAAPRTPTKPEVAN